MNDDPLWFIRTLVLMLCFAIIILATVSTVLTIVGTWGNG